MFGAFPAFGLYVRHARDVSLRNVELSAEQPDVRPALVADDVTGLHVVGLNGRRAGGDAPALWLNNVRGGLVETGIATDGAGTILRVTGEDTERITLRGPADWTPECHPSGPTTPSPATAVAYATRSAANAERRARVRLR